MAKSNFTGIEKKPSNVVFFPGVTHLPGPGRAHQCVNSCSLAPQCPIRDAYRDIPGVRLGAGVFAGITSDGYTLEAHTDIFDDDLKDLVRVTDDLSLKLHRILDEPGH
jgi:hypothetical protein